MVFILRVHSYYPAELTIPLLARSLFPRTLLMLSFYSNVIPRHVLLFTLSGGVPCHAGPTWLGTLYPGCYDQLNWAEALGELTEALQTVFPEHSGLK